MPRLLLDENIKKYGLFIDDTLYSYDELTNRTFYRFKNINVGDIFVKGSREWYIIIAIENDELTYLHHHGPALFPVSPNLSKQPVYNYETKNHEIKLKPYKNKLHKSKFVEVLQEDFGHWSWEDPLTFVVFYKNIDVTDWIEYYDSVSLLMTVSGMKAFDIIKR